MAIEITDVQPDGLYHNHSAPDRYWSTANAGEALPGVITPLAWSSWGLGIELAMRDCFVRMGALEPARNRVPDDPSDRAFSAFYGRAALSVSHLAEMGTRLPGTSSDAIAKQLLGEAPADLQLQRDNSRIRQIAVGMPTTLVKIRGDVLRDTAHIHDWWTGWIKQADGWDIPAAQRVLDDAVQKLIDMTILQARAVFAGVQPVYDQLTALVDKAGLDPSTAQAIMAGTGSHAETEIIADLWKVGREQLTLEAFLDRHGYHGPREGDLTAKMWREDPEPVKRLAAQYGQRPESDHPARQAEKRVIERKAAERRLLAAVPLYKRPQAEIVLRLAVKRIPLRGIAKEALIRALDVIRAAARRMGALYTEQGILSEPDDALYFTHQELLAGLTEGAAQTARERRELRGLLLGYDVPQHWKGMPEPVALATPEPSGDGAAAAADDGPVKVTGVPGSGGTVEGVVRLVDDPAEAEVEPGEVLVCPTTDPSWASILFLAAALVVDIGGPLSHAAVVAREIGIPAVVGTNNGTQLLRAGDRVRVNGDDGSVELLARAGTPEVEGTSA